MTSIEPSAITLPGLGKPHQGKVRDTYELPGYPGLLLVVASDRISVFDFVLNALVPYKGEILTALNIFWRLKFEHYKHDLVAFGWDIRPFLPKNLRNYSGLLKRAIVVKKVEMYPIEAIIRGYLTGSGWEAYKKTNPHVVCGQMLPDDLRDGSQLPTPIFTPTTKAKVGHDEHISAHDVIAQYGSEFPALCLSFYEEASAYAAQRGIIIADTKFECGKHNTILTLADEVLTPDSSRFWDVNNWRETHAEGRMPKSFDKQFVREWAKTLGIHKKDPTVVDDYAWVASQVVPEDIVGAATNAYREILFRLTGTYLEEFQRSDMHA